MLDSKRASSVTYAGFGACTLRRYLLIFQLPKYRGFLGFRRLRVFAITFSIRNVKKSQKSVSEVGSFFFKLSTCNVLLSD